MNGRTLGILLILLGFIILIFLAVKGLVHVGLFLFIPFAVSSTPVAIIPFLLIFSGVALYFISTPVINRDNWHDENYPENKEKHIGGFIMIGPVPIIFGNDKKLIYISIIVAVSIIVIYIILAFNLL